MRPSYSVLRQRRGSGASLGTVIDDLRVCLQPKTTTRCMNPECPELCEWPEGRGRPPLFHHRLCQEKYQLARRRLTAEISDLVAVLDQTPKPAGEDRIYLENQLARRRWLLARYPELP
ncbi:MAG: hypothetical protein LCH98_14200 [Actinobacteria bacterium]|nr:hypothetical protein [Actinomycetota bacterium]